MAVLDDILNSGTIGDSLDLGAKYAAERARMRAGEQRIADAKSNLRNMELPTFMRPELSSAGKLMAADMRTDRTAQARDDIQRAFQGTLAANRGRGLAQKLRALGGGLADIFQKGEAARLASASAVSPEMQAVGQEERALDRERKMFDFRKDRQIEALDDQLTRLQGAYGDTQGKMGRDVLKMIRENPELANIFKKNKEAGDTKSEGTRDAEETNMVYESEPGEFTDFSNLESIFNSFGQGATQVRKNETTGYLADDPLAGKIQDIEQDDEVFEDDIDYSRLLKTTRKQPGQFKNIFEYIKQLRGL